MVNVLDEGDTRPEALGLSNILCAVLMLNARLAHSICKQWKLRSVLQESDELAAMVFDEVLSLEFTEGGAFFESTLLIGVFSESFSFFG